MMYKSLTSDSDAIAVGYTPIREAQQSRNHAIMFISASKEVRRYTIHAKLNRHGLHRILQQLPSWSDQNLKT